MAESGNPSEKVMRSKEPVGTQGGIRSDSSGIMHSREQCDDSYRNSAWDVTGSDDGEINTIDNVAEYEKAVSLTLI
jgi:hypothetical protein